LQNKSIVNKIQSMKNSAPSPSRFFPVKGAADARKEGYRSLTRPYLINCKDESIRMLEREWWDRLCNDLKSCDCVIVEFTNGLELWRHDDELDIDPMTGLKHQKFIDDEP
jgi:hypothetical protein